MTAPEPEATPEPAWKPKRPEGADGPGNGPSWRAQYAAQSLGRIMKAPTVETVIAQALVEQVVLLHSLRRILIWTLVLVPLIMTAIGIILIASGQAAEPKDCGLYGTRC